MKRSHSYNSELNYSHSSNPIKLAIIGAGRDEYQNFMNKENYLYSK